MAKKPLTPYQQVEQAIEKGLVIILAEYEKKDLSAQHQGQLINALTDLLLANQSPHHPGYVFRVQPNETRDGYAVTLQEKPQA